MKINRNDPCPCGSGNKYKKCCWEKDEKAKREQRAASPAAGAALGGVPAQQKPARGKVAAPAQPSAGHKVKPPPPPTLPRRGAV